MAKPKMILVVDDDPELLDFCRDYFKVEGYNAMLIDDPEKAMRMARIVHPDLVILDIKMPKVDGFQVMTTLRNDNPAIKIMILSSFIEGEIEEKVKAADVQAIVKKPISFEELEKHILKILKTTKQEIQDKIPAGGRPEIRVLFVDDEQDFREYMQQVFNDHGFPTDVAASGEEGLEMIDKKAYDVLFSDNQMPGMDGLQFVQKALMKGSHKPHAIALCTAIPTSEIIEKFRRIGVTQFFYKPFLLHELIQWLQDQIPEIISKRAK